MSARVQRRTAALVDRERFAAAVLAGLTNPELAARFSISQSVASTLAVPLRKKKGRQTRAMKAPPVMNTLTHCPECGFRRRDPRHRAHLRKAAS